MKHVKDLELCQNIEIKFSLTFLVIDFSKVFWDVFETLTTGILYQKKTIFKLNH
jgi:hypothetical protein